MKLRITTLLLVLTAVSCQQTTHNEKEISALKNQADSITTVSQNVLLQNVAAAIQKDGTEYAVNFCHVKAIPITDSLSKEVRIDRKSVV